MCQEHYRVSTIDEQRNALMEMLRGGGAIQDESGLELKVDFFLSSILGNLSLHPLDRVWEWFLKKRSESNLKTEIIPLKETDGWLIDERTGNIHHGSGKFFSIKGIKVSSDKRETKDWSQPVIDQPEVGILGFLVKKIHGIYHFLVQAKEEPGNIDNVQLTTTLMATRSNFKQVHGGKEPFFLDYFTNPEDRRVLVKELQSEEGARFYKKNNLNIVIELHPHEEVDVPKMFIWMTLCQIKEFLTHENTVNACARSVIACLP